MAGRPKTMVKRVTPLEEAAFWLYRDLHGMRPAQYAARQYDEEETQDELCSCWNEAVEEVGEALDRLQELLELLEQRAGLSHRLLYLQRARSRGLLKEPLGQPVEEPVALEGESVESGG